LLVKFAGKIYNSQPICILIVLTVLPNNHFYIIASLIRIFSTCILPNLYRKRILNIYSTLFSQKLNLSSPEFFVFLSFIPCLTFFILSLISRSLFIIHRVLHLLSCLFSFLAPRLPPSHPCPIFSAIAEKMGQGKIKKKKLTATNNLLHQILFHHPIPTYPQTIPSPASGINKKI